MIVHPQQWGVVTVQQIYDRGGAALLGEFYNNSLFHALCDIFKGASQCPNYITSTEISWDKSWFLNIPSRPSGYWKPKENQRKFLDQFAAQYSIRQPQEWVCQRIT